MSRTEALRTGARTPSNPHRAVGEHVEWCRRRSVVAVRLRATAAANDFSSAAGFRPTTALEYDLPRD